MSDISKPSNCKRRIHEIDETIEHLSDEVKNLNDFVFKTELESSLQIAKLKREKVKALTAVAKSQVILADMEILIAETDLYTDLVRMSNRKKLKLDREEGRIHKKTQDRPVSTTKSRSTKPTQAEIKPSTSDQKKKKKSSSSKSKHHSDISSDETVIVESLPVSKSTPIKESQTAFRAGSLNQKKNSSDSDISLPNSIKAEFNNPYPRMDDVKSETNAQNKKETKNDSKNKPSSSLNHKSPTITTKSVADINKSLFSSSLHNSRDSNSNSNASPKHRQQKRTSPYEKKLPVTTSTYVPVRHNLPMIITQPRHNIVIPSTSMPSPHVYVSSGVAQPSLYLSPSMNSQTFSFYGNKQ